MYRADLNHDLIGHLLTDRNPGFLDSHDHIAVVYRYHCNVDTGYKSHGLQMTLYFLFAANPYDRYDLANTGHC